jgi:hypothetical protein
MENLYYPTGKETNGRTVVCLCCEDNVPILESIDNPKDIELELKNWLDENNYCVESWQIDNRIKECGYGDYIVTEMEGGMGGAPLATLNTTPGMGNVIAPSGSGTNAAFHDPGNVGSGDKFPTLTAGTPAASKNKKKKKRTRKIKNFEDFLISGKFLQGK